MLDVHSILQKLHPQHFISLSLLSIRTLYTSDAGLVWNAVAKFIALDKVLDFI